MARPGCLGTLCAAPGSLPTARAHPRRITWNDAILHFEKESRGLLLLFILAGVEEAPDALGHLSGAEAGSGDLLAAFPRLEGSSFALRGAGILDTRKGPPGFQQHLGSGKRPGGATSLRGSVGRFDGIGAAKNLSGRG